MKRIVYAPGVWDMLHIGHLSFLQKASTLGDLLIVGVPTDKVVIEDKGRPPIISCPERLRMLNALECVSTAVIYNRLEFISHLETFEPTVFAIGEYFGGATRHTEALTWCENHNTTVARISYYAGESTSKIVERVLDRGAI